MDDLLTALRKGPLLADGAMGSYLFRRTGRLSERGHVYEALNLDSPETVRDVHLAYLRAGAQCLTTNSFSANRRVLRSLGEDTRLSEVNRGAVQVAREAQEIFKRQQNGSQEVYLLGSVGPVPDPIDKLQINDVYGAQLEALLESGVDAILLETFANRRQILDLAEYVMHRSGGAVPLIAEMTLQRDSEQAWAENPLKFVEPALELGIPVVGINCCAPWDALAFLDELETLPSDSRERLVVSVMPNAGGFQRIGNRFMTRVNPEYLGELARTLARRGVRLIGGCCEVHPRHLREMHNFLHGYLAPERVVEIKARVDLLEPPGARDKACNGPFSKKLFAGAFAVSVEIVPPRGTSPEVLNNRVAVVESLAESGLVDAIDITDGSRGISLMPPGDFVAIVRERLGWGSRSGDGVEFIPHFTCRDLNLMGLQSRLIGFHACRIRNVLFITGDPPKMSPTYPRSTAVFDADSVTMIRCASGLLNAGLDFGGQLLARKGDPRTSFTVGSGFEPEALDREREQEKLRRKIDAGVDYLMTQPVFRPEPLGLLEPYRQRLPILAGVLILTGLDHARRIAEVPGVVVPETLFSRFERFESRDDQLELGIEIAVEQVEWVRRDGWAGLYLMSPASSRLILRVLESAFGPSGAPAA